MVLSAKINVIFKLLPFVGFFCKYIFFPATFTPLLDKKDNFAGELTPYVFTLIN